MNSVKEIDIKNRTYNFLDVTINMKNYDRNKFKIS